MKKKVINILFNDFTNDNRVMKECRSLTNYGYDIILVATRFDSKLPKEEKIEGIRVIRFNVGKNKLLPLNLIKFWIQIVKNFKEEMIFHCNDLYALPPAYFIKRFINKDVKIVYDCHEHETEASIYIGKPILKLFAKISEKLMIKVVDKVIVVSESIANDYEKMYGIPKPYLILNCSKYKKQYKKDLFRKEYGLSKDKVIFLFQGEYSKGKGVGKLIEVFSKLEKIREDLVLILLVYGDGTEILKHEISEHKNIFWHEKAGLSQYMDYVASADWGFILLENISKNNDYALPNKLFDYISAGLPAIVSNLSEMKLFVKKNMIGYVIDPNKTNDLIKLVQNSSEKKRREFLPYLEKAAKRYTWENQEKKLIKLYDSLYK